MNVINKEVEFAPTNEMVAVALSNCCQADEVFAEKLKKDPLQLLRAMNEESGVPIPDISVRTVQNTESVVHVPLPAYSQMPEMEKYMQEQLTDEQLKDIAGGEIIGSIVVGLATAAWVAGSIGIALGLSGGAAIAVGVAIIATVAVGVTAGVVGGSVTIAHGTGAI